MAEARTEWVQKIEKVRSRDEKIQFAGKIFVFTGFGKGDSHPAVQQVIARGGELRSKVSGLTDYLVINPEGMGERKAQAALEQKEKGSDIKFLLLEDLEQALKQD